ncbi:transcriptional regulator [Enterovibrio norvegicus FF-33]|uniref:Transcriptional regulator n=1 Tax=Enterovibrio norvegicus FF-454 TaxID=1185651 RepID=A0A1E5CBM8_9GAMM|nr:TetR/AcrR family transcriptional regulator [Enterovibrio norvegicus]OEE62865.1 transcriptional regulator [Enterovibrio norvegicus FF-454]OEE66789.1 transcriptional regulator [Enterovibrio norvegicus FF-33]
MSKKSQTREQILSIAFEMASQEGLESLTIGELAKRVGMSKSGLFAHFNSRSNLQAAVVAYAGERFAERVIAPCREALHVSIEAKIRHMLDNWLTWNSSFQGSCMFLDAWRESHTDDDPMQKVLEATIKKWLHYLHIQFERGIELGEFHDDMDCWQTVYELYGLYLSSHLFRTLGLESNGAQKFWTGIDELFARTRKLTN